MAGIEGKKEFIELSKEMNELGERVPDAMDRGIKKTAKELRVRILEKIDNASTSKGGTFESNSSTYSPGGENKSTKKSGKLQSKRSWKIEKIPVTSSEANAYMVSPKSEIQYRAKVFEEGTPGASPDDVGDDPMYFRIKTGQGIIVVSDVPPEREDGTLRPLTEQFDGEPMGVEGVESNNGIAEAVQEFKREDRLEKNVEEEVEEAASKVDKGVATVKSLF